MKILLTNDDGYNAPGILALYHTLRPLHEVVLIAPDREKSAVSHGITLNEPLSINAVDLARGGKGYAVTGTPADCIKLGLFALLPVPPDLVISGINPGSNTGININYSGTVGAAREAALNGLPAMAVSMLKRKNPPDFPGMACFIARIVDRVRNEGLARGTFLNINAPHIPLDEVKGVKITRQAAGNLSTVFEKRIDPRKKTYFWYGAAGKADEEPDTDVAAVSQHYISITPIKCDITDYQAMESLEPFPLK